ncbi:MAG: DUF378 domain-containing protein [bacterium]|nr:DUF378 domain-containing protein [bacterium]
MKAFYMILLILVLIGGLNWGLVGFFDYNLVDAIFGAGSMGSRVIYAIVGVSAVLVAIMVPMMKDKKSV